MVLRRPQGIFGAADSRFLLRIFTARAVLFPAPALPGPAIGWMLKHAAVRRTASPSRFANQPFTARAHDAEKRVPSSEKMMFRQ
jgi:hypothetical protein